MHVVSRILFWSSLVGLALALVAPILSGGASWAEAEAGVVVGLVFTFAFGIASIATVSGRDLNGNIDPIERSAKRRSGGIAYSLLAVLIMGGFGAVAFTRASSDRDVSIDPTLPHYEQSYRLDVAADATNGMTSGIMAFVGASIAFFAFVGFLAKQPLRAHRAWSAQTAPRSYPSYDPHAHVRAVYGPTPAPMPVEWHAQARAQSGSMAYPARG